MIEISPEIKKLIEQNPVALATINEDNTPHSIIVAYVKVTSKTQVLITDNHMVQTTKNIKRNKNIALSLYNKEWKKDCIGYELNGTAEYFSSGTFYQKVKEIPENENEHCKGAILITINKIKKLS
jgi:predicted pyridoxine 5'-phosphate oxidase superfamily flavin-nucleotide-binding protein